MVAPGKPVERGDELVTIEAMKMFKANSLASGRTIIAEVHVSERKRVAQGDRRRSHHEADRKSFTVLGSHFSVRVQGSGQNPTPFTETNHRGTGHRDPESSVPLCLCGS